jgi:hypothetical protein
MSEAIMAEEVKPEEKVAFANRKYSNEDRIKKEEKELAELIAEQKGETKAEAEEVKEEEPANAEEKSFKKRYGDLRRHSQKQLQEHVDKINALQKQLEQSTKQEIKLPKSDEDIDAWASQYPDVAAIVETIAIKKAKEQASGLEARVKEIDEMREAANREKAGSIKESAVQKMSAQQYEKNAEAIMEAIRTGKFIYDVSGNAR